MLRGSFGRLLVAVGALGVVLASSVALGSVRREGSWPGGDKVVKLDADGIPRADAVKRLADAAGWSIVFNAPATDTVNVHVQKQPADKVLEFLLSDANYVATRDGTLISIVRAPADAATAAAPTPPTPPTPATPPTPPAPPAPPAVPTARGSDRVISGGSLTIEKGETVHDLAVFGGSADIWGTVTGDVTVMGGSAHVHEGGHVLGDAEAVGGSMVIDDGARVDGDVAAVGGTLERGDRAQIGGDVVENGHGHGKVRVRDDHDDEPVEDAHASAASRARQAARDAGSAVTRTALLFVLGAVLLALGSSRMERLQAEVAARPMRSFALGVVGVLVALVLVIALCVIIVGIPFAIIGILLAVLAVAVGLCATLTTLGAGLLGHRSQSPYVHLAVGCAVLLVLGAIPFLGAFVKAAAVLIGIGAVVATRGAGLIPPRSKNGAPYREAPLA